MVQTKKGRDMTRPLPDRGKRPVKKEPPRLSDQQIIEEVWKRQVKRGVIV